ncbi:hypothetical protein EDB83DRAFT_1347197 [Lactarius deliciosus]|nr:hypothetical protein EDB83DRAFT_1347197 [Lactarius deliciosus]
MAVSTTRIIYIRLHPQFTAMQAQSRSQSPKFQASLQITLIRVALALCALFPGVAHVLVQTFRALVLFVVPLCILAFHSHMHIQMRRLLSPPTSSVCGRTVNSPMIPTLPLPPPRLPLVHRGLPTRAFRSCTVAPSLDRQVLSCATASGSTAWRGSSTLARSGASPSPPS